MFVQQKNKAKVNFTTPEDQNTVQKLSKLLQSQFQKNSVDLGVEYTLSQDKIDEYSEEIRSFKSFKTLKRQVDTNLRSLNKLLIKQLMNSLEDILHEVFDNDLDQITKENGTTCLIIFYKFIKISTISRHHYSKVLKWIYEITSINSMELSLELCNVVCSIKKKMIKLGYSLMKNIKEKKSLGNIQSIDQQEFKLAVQQLIRQKQEEVSCLKFELCRVCQKFMPLTSIAAHMKLCQKIHQTEYLQSKLEDKGNKLLNIINNSTENNQQRYNLKIFFDRIYTTIGEVLVTFGLKNQIQELEEVIEQYKVYQAEIYIQIIELLRNYVKCLKINADGDNLSDKDEKKVSQKKKYKINKFNSNTSLIPSVRTVELEQNASQISSYQQIASQKTINTDTQAMFRYNPLKLKDFQVLASIGKGSYSQVFLVRKRNTKDLFAMKVIQIQCLNKERMHAFKQEQKIYKSIAGNFNVKLYYSFGVANLYFLILDYGCGGSLRDLLQKQVYFQQKYAKVYIANLILAVNSIHRLSIVHRDLKPENIVINQLGQLVLTDFNLSKLMTDRDDQKSNTFFGTPDYIAPQVLRGETADRMIDYFSVGAIAYQMVIGVTPFTDHSPQEVFQNILKGQIEWPQVGQDQGQITKQCKNLLLGLLNPNPKQRLGYKGVQQFQNHPFFEGVNWSAISQCQFFYIPQEIPKYEQNYELLNYIESKMKNKSEKIIEDDSIVRYDILKAITNKNVRSHRNSRFKLEKQLEVLKLLPSSKNVKLKKHNSHNNFNHHLENIAISCQYLHEPTSTLQQ